MAVPRQCGAEGHDSALGFLGIISELCISLLEKLSDDIGSHSHPSSQNKERGQSPEVHNLLIDIKACVRSPKLRACEFSFPLSSSFTGEQGKS